MWHGAQRSQNAAVRCSSSEDEPLGSEAKRDTPDNLFRRMRGPLIRGFSPLLENEYVVGEQVNTGKSENTCVKIVP